MYPANDPAIQELTGYEFAVIGEIPLSSNGIMVPRELPGYARPRSLTTLHIFLLSSAMCSGLRISAYRSLHIRCVPEGLNASGQRPKRPGPGV